MTYLDADFSALWPSIILAGGGLMVLLMETMAPVRRFATAVSVLALAGAAAVLYGVGRTSTSASENLLALEVATDQLTLALAPALFLSALAALILALPYLRKAGKQRNEFQALILFSVAGMVLMVQARDLLMLFLALETLSIPLYVLAGFFTDKEHSVESAMKYFVVGAFSSAFVAFGIALTYGATGTLSLDGVQAALAGLAPEAAGRLALAHVGLAFLLVGFGFKIGMVPFHAWAPDVYQGAPTPVTAFLSVGSKAAGFAGLMRLMLSVFPSLPGWVPMLSLLAAVTLIIGNCVATLQEDVKRLIAYSGISHAGFLLMGLVAHQELSGGRALPSDLDSLGQHPALLAIAFYLVSYAFMTLGALAIVQLIEGEYNRDTRIVDYAGLAQRRPILAAALFVFLMSLGGMPPLAGFLGKYLIFSATLSAGQVGLAVVAALSSVVAFYYYLRIVMQMYLRPSRDEGLEAMPVPALTGWLVGLALAGTLVFGLVPGLLLNAL